MLQKSVIDSIMKHSETFIPQTGNLIHKMILNGQY